MNIPELWSYVFPFAFLLIFANCVLASCLDTKKNHLPIAMVCAALLFAPTFLMVMLDTTGQAGDIMLDPKIGPLMRLMSSIGYQMVITVIFLVQTTWTLSALSKAIKTRKDAETNPAVNRANNPHPALNPKGKARPSIFKS
ncbi:hypothetical protein RYA05_03150 [Pseudomonas syringae pv. actinidiae]|nr:hypothetical protein [Pseudomonas syringae pv. actinidiae]